MREKERESKREIMRVWVTGIKWKSMYVCVCVFLWVFEEVRECVRTCVCVVIVAITCVKSACEEKGAK